MEHATQALIVITLLQLCRAEISEIIPGTWFSANAINDGYSPKPILELFSTEPPSEFSPTKPIIVLPSSPPQPDPEVTHLSTSAPYLISSSAIPSSTPQSYSTTYSSTPYPTTLFQSTPSPNFETSSTPFPSSKQTSSFTLSSSQSPEAQSVTTAFPPPENFPIFNFPNSPQLASNPPQTTISDTNQREGKTQPLRYDIVQHRQTLQTIPFLPGTQPTGIPNFVVLYENTPRTPLTQTTSQAPIQFPSSETTKPIASATPSTDPVTPFITNTFPDGTSRPTVTFRSTPPAIPTFTTSIPIVSTVVSSVTPLANVTVPPKSPNAKPGGLQIQPGPPKRPFVPDLKIRIVAPKGSITNVKINPTTTTRCPSTKKPKKNSFEGCVDHCKGRDPLCAVPLGTLIVEPHLLKGFPSICHMACHNSFKKDPYEKIVDGRCGKIRTRIIRVDSKTKMHREELKKSEYSIINTGPKAVVELAGANIDKKRKQ